MGQLLDVTMDCGMWLDVLGRTSLFLIMPCPSASYLLCSYACPSTRMSACRRPRTKAGRWPGGETSEHPWEYPSFFFCPGILPWCWKAGRQFALARLLPFIQSLVLQYGYTLLHEASIVNFNCLAYVFYFEKYPYLGRIFKEKSTVCSFARLLICLPEG